MVLEHCLDCLLKTDVGAVTSYSASPSSTTTVSLVEALAYSCPGAPFAPRKSHIRGDSRSHELQLNIADGLLKGNLSKGGYFTALPRPNLLCKEPGGVNRLRRFQRR